MGGRGGREGGGEEGEGGGGGGGGGGRGAGVGGGGEVLMALWEEYEAGESAEARLVKDMDKLEMIAQAMEYETEENTGRGEDLEEFFESTRGRYRTATGEAWSEEIERRRPRAG